MSSNSYSDVSNSCSLRVNLLGGLLLRSYTYKKEAVSCKFCHLLKLNPALILCLESNLVFFFLFFLNVWCLMLKAAESTRSYLCSTVVGRSTMSALLGGFLPRGSTKTWKTAMPEGFVEDNCSMVIPHEFCLQKMLYFKRICNTGSLHIKQSL